MSIRTCRLVLVSVLAVGASACAVAGSVRDAAWKQLPAGAAAQAIRRTEHHRSADDPLGGTTRVYVIEAQMSEDDFEAWCASVGMTPADGPQEQRADGKPVGYRRRGCMGTRDKVQQEISFLLEDGREQGMAVCRAWRD